jgi:hypothetical protein
MPSVKLRASVILGAFEEAQSELVGKAVVLTDGKAGTVESVCLDEFHGLRISIGGHDGKWPISTIKFAEKSSSAQAGRTRPPLVKFPRHVPEVKWVTGLEPLPLPQLVDVLPDANPQCV